MCARFYAWSVRRFSGTRLPVRPGWCHRQCASTLKRFAAFGNHSIVSQCARSASAVRVAFACDALMDWCEPNRVDFLFGLAHNLRLEAEIGAELWAGGRGV